LVADKFEIRNCSLKDLSRVEQIENASFSNPYSALTFWTLAHGRNNIFRVITVNGAEESFVVGYSIAKIERDEDDLFIGHLISLAVAPGYRRHGIGTKLLDDVLIQIKNNNVSETTRVLLEVRIANQDAISLYKRFGFIVESTLLNYYGPGTHAYCMTLDLK
jgi:[ribosomal protein S18]-alanine N-acetyltransferase